MSLDEDTSSEFSQATSTARADARGHQECIVTGDSTMGRLISRMTAYIADDATYVREEIVDARVLRIIYAAEVSRLRNAEHAGTFSATRYTDQLELDGGRLETLEDHPDRRIVAVIPVTYSTSKHGSIGRLFAEAADGRQSMQRCNGATRAHLVKGLTFDLDQVNAIPQIATQVFEMLGFEQPAFIEYVERRDAIFETMLTEARVFAVDAAGEKRYHAQTRGARGPPVPIELRMPRGIAKQLWVTILHGGSSETWIEENHVVAETMEKVEEKLDGFLQRYELEVRRLLRALFKRREFSVFNTAYDAYQHHKEEEGHPGKYAALLFQTMESICFLATDRALPDFGFPNGHAVWLFDGGLIRGSDGDMTEEILAGLSAAVKEHTGLSIQLKVKPADRSETLAYAIGVNRPAQDDRQAAIFVAIAEKGALINVTDSSEHQIWCNNKDSGLWSSNASDFYALAMQEEYLPFLGVYSKLVGKMSNMQTAVTALPNIREGKAWTQKLNTGLAAGEVPFDDKIYNVLTSESRPIKSEDLLTLKFKEPAPKPHETYETEVAAVLRMLREIFPEEGLLNHVMEHIAESLFTPSNPHKYFAQVYGSGNNAKSYLFHILALVFPEWVAQPDPKHFIIQKGHSNANGATPWLIDVMGTRIVVTEEPPLQNNDPSGEIYMDGNLLKRLRGDNMIVGRRLNKNNISYTPTFTVWFVTNKLVNITPHDQAITDSFLSYRAPSVFLDQTKLDEAKRGEGQNAGDDFLYLRDDSLKNKFKSRSYKMALLYVLAEFFRSYTKRGRCFTEEASKFVLAKLVYEQAVALTLYQLFYRLFTVLDLTPLGKMPRTQQSEILKILEANGFPIKSNRELTAFLNEKFALRRINPGNKPTWIGIVYSPPVEDVAEDVGGEGGGGEGGGGDSGGEGGGGDGAGGEGGGGEGGGG